MTQRFTVAHVLRDQSLRDNAERYLKQWNGTFEFLAAAQAMVNRGEPLPAPIVKGVLNCMQADGRVKNMPEPPDLTYDAGGNSTDRDDPFAEREPYNPPRREVKMKSPWRGYHGEVPMRTKWNRPHIISTARNAKLVHQINPFVSRIEFWRDEILVGHGEGDWFRWRIELYCQPTFYMMGTKPRFVFSSRYVFLTPEWARDLVYDKKISVPWMIQDGSQVKELESRDWKWCMKCGITKERDHRETRSQPQRTT